MPLFEIFVEDDRYVVPTLHLLTVDDEAEVRAFAEQLLFESVHHRAVEALQGGVHLFTVDAAALYQADLQPEDLDVAGRLPPPKSGQDADAA